MDSIIYLDNAATSYPKPESVYEFMDQFFRRAGVNPGRSGYDLCLEAGQLVDKIAIDVEQMQVDGRHIEHAVEAVREVASMRAPAAGRP